MLITKTVTSWKFYILSPVLSSFFDVHQIGVQERLLIPSKKFTAWKINIPNCYIASRQIICLQRAICSFVISLLSSLMELQTQNRMQCAERWVV